MPRSHPPTIFFSAGEPSGDLHGANLIRQLHAQCPGLRAVGYGGPEMAAAGCQLHADLTALAVMWFARALLNLHKFWDLASRADRYFRHQRPDAVVLIDYPGFNWWIARRAKAHGIPVFYYTPPQIWAWARWRVKKMRRLTDHVLCSLPFEAPWFRRHGCNATFVGHPFFDEVRRHADDRAFLESHRKEPGPLVAILPGSRTQEVASNLRWFLRAAARIRQAVPEVRFALACFKPYQAEIARRLVGQSGLAVEVCTGKTPELMQLADCAIAVSGSVSLELLYHTTPTVILYWVSRPAYFVQGFFRRVKYITLVNLLSAGGLDGDGEGQEGSGFRVQGSGEEDGETGRHGDKDKANRENDTLPLSPSPPLLVSPPSSPILCPPSPNGDRVLFPEYLTCEDKSQEIAGHVIEWLTDPGKRAQRVAELAALKAQVGHGGASRRAAEYILAALATTGGNAAKSSPGRSRHSLLPNAAPLRAEETCRS